MNRINTLQTSAVIVACSPIDNAYPPSLHPLLDDVCGRTIVSHIVHAISERIEFAADWRPGFAPGLSFDLQLSYRSPEVATVNNLVSVPTRTLIDLGGRYRFRIAGNNAVLRIQTSNLFDTQGFDLRGANAYNVLPGRVTQIYFTVDF